MKKIKNIISLLLVSAVLTGCAENTSSDANPSAGAFAEKNTLEEELAQLKWGMSLDEVDEIITVSPDAVENVMSADLPQTLFTFENQVFEGYNSYLIVCVMDDTGLDGINYHIPTESPETVYKELGKMLSDQGGLYDPTTDTFSLWHFDDDNYTVMLASWGAEVQLSYYPLFDKESRGENCGEEFVYEEIIDITKDLEKLKWGMSVEEVEEILPKTPNLTVEETESAGIKQTLFTYSEHEYDGYDSYLIICVSEGTGLDGINYHLPTDAPDLLYDELSESLQTSDVIYDPTDETFSFWHYDNDNYTVMLANFGTEVQLSYFPLFAVEDRSNNFDSSYEIDGTENTQTETYFFMEDNTLADCDPIDKSLNCEEILLNRADSLQKLMTEYLNHDEKRLCFDLGETIEIEKGLYAKKVISDKIKSKDDIKNIFSEKIYEEYTDKLCSFNPSFLEIEDELYFIEADSGLLGVFETWYLGYDVTDDKIIGHFAVLEGIEDIGLDDAEYLNDESNYDFYDITVQNVDGKYVITDCNAENTKGFYFYHHGYYYNSGKADRTLITNENVKPKFIEGK